MCKCNSTSISPLGQVTAALELNGGTWQVKTVGQNPGDYLCMAPEHAAHVVRVTDTFPGPVVYGCTCKLTLWDNPVSDVNAGCVHIGLVMLFRALKPREIAATLGTVLRHAMAGRTNGRDVTALATRAALLQDWFTQRTAARVLRVPATEAASAASLAGLVSHADAYAAEWATDETGPIRHAVAGCMCDDGSCWPVRFAAERAIALQVA